MSAVENLRAAMLAAGLDYSGPIHADGKLHRVKVDGDKARNSWFVLNSGTPAAGAFGCWKRSIKETWCAKRRENLSAAEWQNIRQQWQLADAERQRTEAERHAKARKIAAWILARSKPATSHAYLDTKGVKIPGDVREHRGALVLPLHDVDGEVHSLQFIGADGGKRFLTGGKIAGCFFTLADDSIFAFAGIWERWKSPAGEPVVACSIITTAANSLVASIHDRMPVILERDAYDVWLNPGMKKAADLLYLLQPYRPGLMRRYRVSSRVNSVKNDDPACAEEYIPGNLFKAG